MGALKASDVFQRAFTILLDDTNVRWTLPELCNYLNDAQREIVLQKPSALSANIPMALVAGTYQSIPDTYSGLLRITRNLKAMPADNNAAREGARAVRVVAREVLDSQMPDWHDSSITLPKQAVKHYLFDEQDPYHFYVYPPNDGTGVVEAILASLPTTIEPTGDDPTLLSAYETTLDLEDIYVNSMVDYVLYRAYSKDSSFAGNAQRAAFHYQQFGNSIGMKVKLDVQLSPNLSQAPPMATTGETRA